MASKKITRQLSIFINGKEVKEAFVTTPKLAKSLKIWIDESGVPAEAGVNDVLFLYVAAVDENGTIIPDYEEEVTIELNGDVKVMNVGSIIAEAGIATALIQISDTAGEMNVNVTSKELEGKASFSIK